MTSLPLVLALLAPAPQDAVDAERAFVAWATEAALPVDLEAGVDPALLAPLVADARVVYLGEPDHYVAEKYAFRLAFLRALHALGWRHLGMEMGRSDGLRFDRYLATGDEAELLDVALYSSVADADAQVEAGGFLGAEVAYARELRALGAGGERLRYFGFDLDMLPGKGRLDALARVEGVAGAEDLAAAIEYASEEEQPAEAYAALADELSDPASVWSEVLGDARRAALALDLFVLAESLSNQVLRAAQSLDLRQVLAPFERRERAMFRIFDAYLADLGPDERVALTGHDMHLSLAPEGARWAEPGSFFEIPMWPSIGEHVAGRLPGEVYAIWMVYDHGEHLPQALADAPREVASVEGTLEALLAEVPHEVFLLPLSSDDPRSAWLDDEQRFRVNGGVGRGHLRQLTDAVLFVRRVSAP